MSEGGEPGLSDDKLTAGTGAVEIEQFGAKRCFNISIKRKLLLPSRDIPDIQASYSNFRIIVLHAYSFIYELPIKYFSSSIRSVASNQVDFSLKFDFNQLLKYILDFHDEIENASNAFFRSSNLIIYRQNRHIDQMDLLPKEFYFGDPVSHYFAKAWIIDNNTTNAKLNKVSMLSMWAFAKFRYAEGADLQMLEIPYEEDRLYMYIFLPRAKFGLHQLKNELDAETMMKLISKGKIVDLEIEIPRFKVHYILNLRKYLTKFNIGDELHLKFDLPNNTTKPIVISDIIETSFIEVQLLQLLITNTLLFTLI
ncbi:unnamed protein product [Dracunculus medinensis]|uniref:SERPIN domain-containing protein n=1 Tax=Dracunculus medinensis TaxID=318479 RepID=A0A0N4ULR1_DRAME|nr:unnamed protein product [Dracunculus medinensis]